jgi:hypothetical protein
MTFDDKRKSEKRAFLVAIDFSDKYYFNLLDKIFRM